MLFVFAVGLELGASNFSCVFADKRKNSPVDYFAGGSREASPASGTTKIVRNFLAIFFFIKLFTINFFHLKNKI